MTNHRPATTHRPTTTRLGTGLLLLLCAGAVGCDDDPFVEQAGPASERAYERAAIGWTRWALAQPHSTGSPISDPTGERCDVGQSGDIWYLAGTFGGPVDRSCDVPADKRLFFPLVNRWGIFAKDFYASEQEFIDFMTEYFAAHRAATCDLVLRLDGEDLVSDDLEELDEAMYVDVLEPFEVDIDADNWATMYGFEGGKTPMLTDGHFAMLRPLAPGVHTLEFGGMVCDGEIVDFETSARYTIDVAM